jgi:TRAP-type C4-dicarboxylate transport system substrate-binding protein
MKRILAACAALVALSLPAVAQTTWDMPTPYADGNFHTKTVREFAADIDKATAGKLKITVHSNASLIKHPEIKRAVQTGQVAAGEILISILGNEDAMFAFEATPGVATSYADARKLYALAKPYVAARLEKQGLKLLYSVAWPPQGIYTKKDIATAGDLKGTKFRTYNPATARFAELMGAVPTTVQVPELPQAFRTGLVDAMITSGATGVDTQAWDYLTHYYDTQAFLPHNAVFVNKAAFDALPADVQKAVTDAAAAAEARGWAASEALNEGYKKTMAEKGIKVLPAPAQLMTDIRTIGKQMSAEWATKAGPDGAALLAAFAK